MQRWPLLIALVSFGACGGGGDSVAGSTTTVDHAAVLAEHESALLAARLVPVAGYTYVDVTAAEVEAAVRSVHNGEAANGGQEVVAGSSYHGVVASDPSQNKAHTAGGGAEVGFLVMLSFTSVPPAAAEDDPRMLVGLMPEGASTSTVNLGGVPMLLADDPSSDDSRFTYAWLEDGVVTVFDGATTPTMERWLEGYLAALATG